MGDERSVLSNQENMVTIPARKLYDLYATLADATQAAGSGDPNGCLELTAQAKEDVIELHEEYVNE